MRDLGTLRKDEKGRCIGASVAFGINDRGQVVGGAESPTGWRAFLWDPKSGMQDLGALSGDANFLDPRAINRRGQVGGGMSRPQIWDPRSGLRTLSSNEAGGTILGMNDRGEAVGVLKQADGVGEQAAYWDANHVLRMIGTLGGTNSAAYAINNRSQVVGYAETRTQPPSRLPPIGQGVQRAFFWSPERGMRDLGAFDSTGDSYAYAINDRGQVVGMASGERTGTRAALWEKGRIIDLMARLPSASRWVLLRATGINHRGQIIVWGCNPVSGICRALLLTPQSPPDRGEELRWW